MLARQSNSLEQSVHAASTRPKFCAELYEDFAHGDDVTQLTEQHGRQLGQQCPCFANHPILKVIERRDNEEILLYLRVLLMLLSNYGLI